MTAYVTHDNSTKEHLASLQAVDGTDHPMSYTPICSKAGQLAQWVFVARDAPNRKRLCRDCVRTVRLLQQLIEDRQEVVDSPAQRV